MADHKCGCAEYFPLEDYWLLDLNGHMLMITREMMDDCLVAETPDRDKAHGQ